jgi:hypothetical protein
MLDCHTSVTIADSCDIGIFCERWPWSRASSPSQTTVIMVKTGLVLVPILCACLCAISALALSAERFSEELTLRSLRDGKLSSAFEFKYQVNGVPRDPSSFGYGDGCEPC